MPSGLTPAARIEIVEADNRGDKQEGASVTQKLISRDNVVAIVGDPTTGQVALGPVIDAGQRDKLAQRAAAEAECASLRAKLAAVAA